VDFNKAAKTIIRQCERIQKEYDSNSQKRRAKTNNENKPFGNPSVQHCDASLEAAPPQAELRTNVSRSGADSRGIAKHEIVDYETKTNHKRKITKIFRKKNGRKGSRIQRMKAATPSGGNKGKGKHGSGTNENGHSDEVKGMVGILDSRLVHCEEDDAHGRSSLGVTDSAHVIEVDVPGDRRPTDVALTSQESCDLNNNRRPGKKDLSKQLGGLKAYLFKKWLHLVG
jgi:hypothetical protein